MGDAVAMGVAEPVIGGGTVEFIVGEDLKRE